MTEPMSQRVTPRTRIEGKVPTRFMAQNIIRIERVRGASAVTHQDYDSKSIERYDVVNEIIVRPDRESDRQFLVVGIGDKIEFEPSTNEVIIAGVCVEGPGGTVEARECVSAY